MEYFINNSSQDLFTECDGILLIQSGNESTVAISQILPLLAKIFKIDQDQLAIHCLAIITKWDEMVDKKKNRIFK